MSSVNSNNDMILMCRGVRAMIGAGYYEAQALKGYYQTLEKLILSYLLLK